MTKIVPPGDVAKILEMISAQGYEAYVVGGCIRDAVMGREPKDWDIATDARPEEVGRLFEKTVDTGIKHGTVSVMMGNIRYEVTTFRIDGRYADSRRPEKVEFTSRIEDDLRRRDFTINAMAWNPERGIIDPFGGMRDISGRIIRTVGNPEDRFSEDALRMLRAVRFASTLGFGIEAETLDGIRKCSSLICRISAERIREELTAVLVSDDPMKFMLLRDTGLLRYIIPELDACFEHGSCHAGIGEHSLRSVAAAETDMCLRWAMLLHDAGKCTGAGNGETAGTVEPPEPGNRAESADAADTERTGEPAEPVDAEETAESVGAAETAESVGAAETAGIILNRLKFDNKSRNRILRLIKHLSMRIEPERSAVARAVLKAGGDVFADLLKAKRAHIKAALHYSGGGGISEEPHQTDRSRNIAEKLYREVGGRSIKGEQYQNANGRNIAGEQYHAADGRITTEELYQLEMTEAVYRSLLEGGYCLSLKELKINGNDLIRLGFTKGAEIGKVLDHLLDRVIVEPGLNKKEILEKLALEYLNKKQGITESQA